MPTKKNLTWQALTLMAFTAVWGFGNVVNGYANQGLHIVVSWILMFSLYFIPYALTASWATFQTGSVVKSIQPIILQSLCLLVFFFFIWFASKGVATIKRIGAIAGSSMFVMSILYIILTLAAPAISDVHTETIAWNFDTFMPNFDFTYFTTLAILVFAVGGCEKMSPYVNELDNPTKEFPRAMIFMTIMVAITALLGSVAMGLMFDTNNVPRDLMMNGAYYAFAKLGDYYGVGSLFVIIYAIANMLGQMAALTFSIDAPIKIFLSDVDSRFVPKALARLDKKGTPVVGYRLTMIIVGLLISIPAFGIGDMTSLYNWLMRLNAVVMPMHYLWVFVAYMALKKAADHMFSPKYQFTKNRTIGFGFGAWCFFFTAFACVMSIFPLDVEVFSSGWNFQFAMNILTPLILIGSGLLLPRLANKDK